MVQPAGGGEAVLRPVGTKSARGGLGTKSKKRMAQPLSPVEVGVGIQACSPCSVWYFYQLDTACPMGEACSL